MSQNTSLTAATTTNRQLTWKEATPMLMKRIFLSLLMTGVIAISAAAAQAQSTGRMAWPRGTSANNPIPSFGNLVDNLSFGIEGKRIKVEPFN